MQKKFIAQKPYSRAEKTVCRSFYAVSMRVFRSLLRATLRFRTGALPPRWDGYMRDRHNLQGAAVSCGFVLPPMKIKQSKRLMKTALCRRFYLSARRLRLGKISFRLNRTQEFHPAFPVVL